MLKEPINDLSSFISNNKGLLQSAITLLNIN